jgi:hypothetical protein
MAFSTRAREAAAAAGAMLTQKKIFGGGQDAGAEPDIAAPPLSPAPLARMSTTHADGEIMQQLRIMQWKPTQNITKYVRNISRYQLRCNTSQ